MGVLVKYPGANRISPLLLWERDVKDRIYEYLEGRSARSEEIATEVLRLTGAAGVVADKVVEAAVSDDTRFARDPHGFWYVKPSERQIHKASFISLGLRHTDAEGDSQLTAVAASRFMTTGPQTKFGETEVQDKTGTAGFLSFARFREDAIPVAFRLSGVLNAINRASRRLLGESTLVEGICLFRLGRLVFPDQPIPSVEALADAVGLSYVTDRDCNGEAQLQAEIFLHLVGRLVSTPGTVEELMERLYLKAEPMDFEAYAFDERHLGDLPQGPGVYVMRDQEGTVIYVAKSVNLRERVGAYFANWGSRSEKTRGILERIWSVELEVVGSELEALMRETRLIADRKPEFNTQLDVHVSRDESGIDVHFILLLPSAEPESIELFCVRTGRGIDRVRIRSDLADWEKSQTQISRFFFNPVDEEAGVSEEDSRDLEILKRWMRKYREEVNWVDMDDNGNHEDTMRVLVDYVRGFEAEGWEKVWRV